MQMAISIVSIVGNVALFVLLQNYQRRIAFLKAWRVSHLETTLKLAKIIAGQKS
jgi:hypothetical protein